MLFALPTLAGLGASIVKHLTLKNIALALGLTFVLFGGYKGYNWIIDRGAAQQLAKDQPVMDRLTVERDKAKAELKTYKEAYNKFVEDTKAARLLYAKEQKAINDDLQARLTAAEKKAKNRQGKLDNAIPKFIPPAADLMLPLGFVSLFNQSIEAREGSTSSGVSFGPAGTVGEASGITLSEFASVTNFNNGEAVRRGRIIQGWQEWYERTRASWTKAQQASAAEIPKLDSLSDKPIHSNPKPEPLPPPVNVGPPVTPDDSL